MTSLIQYKRASDQKKTIKNSHFKLNRNFELACNYLNQHFPTTDIADHTEIKNAILTYNLQLNNGTAVFNMLLIITNGDKNFGLLGIETVIC